MKAAHTLQFLVNDANSHKYISNSSKSLANLFSLYQEVRTLENSDENTMILLLILKSLSQNPAFSGILRANQMINACPAYSLPKPPKFIANKEHVYYNQNFKRWE